ncbi:hypothetical protein [Shivajiella indica]|uniref:Uncharacterized protein n=1 Tax=Shivajiella indica TaxID=872115 RepID=A0ABW5B3H8_9BACT
MPEEKLETLPEEKSIPLSFYENIIPGDKITVIDKSRQVSELIFIEFSDNRLIGKIYIDPVTFQKVEPYDFSIPVENISQVKGVKRVAQPKSKPGSNVVISLNEFKKISQGEKIKVNQNNGMIHYMYYEGIADSVLTGNSWGNINLKNFSEVDLFPVKIPLENIEKVAVYRPNTGATLGLVLGVLGVAVVIMALMMATNPILVN